MASPPSLPPSPARQALKRQPQPPQPPPPPPPSLTTPPTSPAASPPPWLLCSPSSGSGAGGRLRRTPSPIVITLRDNEVDDQDRGAACWARAVEVDDYVVVNGGGSAAAAALGAFVSWNVRVETLGGSFVTIRKRYSEFDQFRISLIRTFPGFEAAVPLLPPKSVISKFRPRFLEKRRAGLQYFLNCILLNPEFSGSPVLKEFLFD